MSCPTSLHRIKLVTISTYDEQLPIHVLNASNVIDHLRIYNFVDWANCWIPHISVFIFHEGLDWQWELVFLYIGTFTFKLKDGMEPTRVESQNHVSSYVNCQWYTLNNAFMIQALYQTISRCLSLPCSCIFKFIVNATIFFFLVSL